jgi:hypothetical protein
MAVYSTPVNLHRIQNFLFGNISEVFMRTESMFRIFVTSFADPDSGSGAFLTPGSGMVKKSGSGSGMNNPDHIS